MADIENLDIVISADATKSFDALDKLASKFDSLATTINGLNIDKLHEMSSAMNDLNAALKGTSSNSELKNVSAELNKIQKQASKGISSKLFKDFGVQAKGAKQDIEDVIDQYTKLMVDFSVKGNASALSAIKDLDLYNSVPQDLVRFGTDEQDDEYLNNLKEVYDTFMSFGTKGKGPLGLLDSTVADIKSTAGEWQNLTQKFPGKFTSDLTKAQETVEQLFDDMINLTDLGVTGEQQTMRGILGSPFETDPTKQLNSESDMLDHLLNAVEEYKAAKEADHSFPESDWMDIQKDALNELTELMQQYMSALDKISKEHPTVDLSKVTAGSEQKESNQYYDDLADRLQKINNAAKNATKEAGVERFTDDIQRLNGAIKTLSGFDTSKLPDFESLGRGISSFMKALKESRDVNASQYTRLVAGMKKFEDVDAGKIKDLASAVREFGEALDSVNFDNLDRLSNANLGGFASQAESQSQAAPAVSVAVQDNTGPANMEAAAQAALKAGQAAQQAQESTNGYSEALKAAGNAANSFSKMTGGIANTLQKINSWIGKVVSRLKSFGSATKSTSKETEGFSLANNRLYQSLTRTYRMLRLMVIRKILQASITGAQDGFKNLALYSDEVNESLSMLMNSINQLKNTFAAMVSPILTYVAPAFNYLLQLVISVANAIQQLLAALTGKSYWYKAKAYADDYADSLRDAGAAAEQFTTLGIDELNINGDNGSGSGSGSGSDYSDDLFTTEEVESQWADLGNQIRAIASDIFSTLKEAWDTEGTYVMESWKNALNEVWQLVDQVGTDFVTVWTQAATVTIFEDILHVIGDIGQSIANLAGNFREAWAENETGLHILENIRNIIGEITGKIREAADATVEWAKEIDFSPVLQKVESWTSSLQPVISALSGVLSDIYTKVLLPLGNWAIGSGLPALLEVFTDFNNKVDWEGLRESLGDLWEKIEKFGQTVGEGLILFVGDLSELVGTFLDSQTLQNILEGIGNFLDNISAEDVERIAAAFVALQVAIAGFKALSSAAKTVQNITGIIANLPAIAVVAAVAAVIAAIVGLIYLISSHWDDISEFFNGAWAKVQEVWEDVSGWFQEHVIQPLSTAFETVKQALEKFFSDPIGTIEELWDAVSGWFYEHVIEPVSETFSGIYEDITGFFSDAWETIQGVWEDVSGWFEEHVIQPISERFEFIQQAIETFLSDPVGTIEAIWDTVYGWFEENVIQPVQDAFDSAKKFIEKKFSEAWDAISGLWDTVSGWFEEHVIQPVQEFFDSAREFIEEKFQEAWDTISGVWDTVSGWFDEHVIQPVKGFFEEAGQWISDKFDEAWEFVSGIWDDVSGWFDENVIQPVSGFFSGLYEDITGFLSDAWETISGIWDDVSQWFDENVIQPVSGFFSGLYEDISGFFSDAWSDISGVWDSVSGWFEEHVTGPVSTAFETVTGAIGGFFDDAWSAIKSGVVTAMNAVIGVIESAVNGVINAINSFTSGINKAVAAVGDLIGKDWSGFGKIDTITLKRISLSEYAVGGFPDEGSLFLAGEAGAELVGTVGGNTAVASNAEITGITQEIRELREMMQAMMETNNEYQEQIAAKNMSVSIGNREIAQANRSGTRQLGYAIRTT